MATLPVLFVSHGSPMLALATPAHPYVRSLQAMAAGLAEVPTAILVVSAHWQGSGPAITARREPRIIHDFSGFPPALFALDYPAAGDPALAERIAALLSARGLQPRLDPARGLDHGAWAVLRHLFPGAQLPVLQVSLPDLDPAGLVALGETLRPLRDQGVLILGSGGLVHNLRAVDFDAPDQRVDAWAQEAETWFMERLQQGDRPALLAHRRQWPGSAMAAPSSEHLDPLFVALGAAQPGEAARTTFQGWQMGNLSLRCLAWG